MEELIAKFPSQLGAELEAYDLNRFPFADRTVLVGLGGSHLAADLYLDVRPTAPLGVHRDYGLPSEFAAGPAKPPALILSSYSGQTEEVLEAARAAHATGLVPGVITSGGELWALAEQLAWPRVRLPEGWPPRLAFGFDLRALALFLRDAETEAALRALASTLDPRAGEALGQTLAVDLRGTIPLIYAAWRHWPLAYFWKISLNETGKCPAFANVLPEANHNELESFDDASLAKFSFIFLSDEANDGPRLKRRFEVWKEQLVAAGARTRTISIGITWPEILSTALLATWTATYHARLLGQNPLAVPKIEAFKKRL